MSRTLKKMHTNLIMNWIYSLLNKINFSFWHY